MLIDDLKCSGSDFQREGAATEKVRVPESVLTLARESKWKSDERSSLGLGVRESMENRYRVSSKERVR